MKFYTPKAFTLTELLVVMAICTLLLGISVPAANNFGRATSLHAAGGKVTGVLTQARQNAITRNLPTAVVVAADPALEGRNRVFAVYELAAPAAGALSVSADWKQLGKWETLPEGIVLDQTSLLSDPAAVNPPLPNISYRGSQLGRIHYVVFFPDGSICDPNANTLRLAEGHWPAGADRPQYTRVGGQGPANFYDISILSASGRLKINRQ